MSDLKYWKPSPPPAASSASESRMMTLPAKLLLLVKKALDETYRLLAPTVKLG